jgi:hypothetical protein
LHFVGAALVVGSDAKVDVIAVSAVASVVVAVGKLEQQYKI